MSLKNDWVLYEMYSILFSWHIVDITSVVQIQISQTCTLSPPRNLSKMYISDILMQLEFINIPCVDWTIWKYITEDESPRKKNLDQRV